MRRITSGIAVGLLSMASWVAAVERAAADGGYGPGGLGADEEAGGYGPGGMGADEPAVSDDAVAEWNAGFAAFGGLQNGARAAGGKFVLSAPIWGAIGFQANALVGGADDDAVGGGSGHLFWRDPQFGLFGVFGGYATRVDDDFETDYVRLGGEAQLYLGDFTLSAAAGYDVGDDDDEIYARGDLEYFITPDWALTGGYRMINGDHFGAAGMEFQVVTGSRVGFSLFADARVGDMDEYAAFGGGRLYFGSPATLIIRRRHLDPNLSTAIDDFVGLQSRW